MFQRLLHVIAGVDRNTLASCPATDKMWATHLGLSLLLSFTVVFGVTVHATGYMIDAIWMRLAIGFVVASTVLMFDRALCQSDWFSQGSMASPGNTVQTLAEARQSAWRFLRVGMRLSLSLGLAWVIAMFLELAIFSGTISEKIERDRVAANQPIFDRLAQFESQLDAEAEARRAKIAALEAEQRASLAGSPALDPSLAARNEEIERQMKSLALREADMRGEIKLIDEQVQRYADDMIAEELGQKLRPTNSGKAGVGPRYEFAKRQKQTFDAQRAAREADIAKLDDRRAELREAQAQIAAEAQVIRDKERLASQGQRDVLQAEITTARADLKQFEAAKAGRIEELRVRLFDELHYQAKTDAVDPLTRIAAYQALKNDPKDGGTITLFSWMTRFFIIFLEIVPVVAKIFFSPPSVYAAKIQAEVERARRRVASDIPVRTAEAVSPVRGEAIVVPDGVEERRKSTRRIANRRVESRPKTAALRWSAPRSLHRVPSLKM